MYIEKTPEFGGVTSRGVINLGAGSGAWGPIIRYRSPNEMAVLASNGSVVICPDNGLMGLDLDLQPIR